MKLYRDKTEDGIDYKEGFEITEDDLKIILINNLTVKALGKEPTQKSIVDSTKAILSKLKGE